MIEREQIQAVLTNYSVSAEIGRGAFGVVFEGEHRNLERPVAIKVLSETLAVDAQVRERFRREARILAGLDHPNVTRVFDYLEEDGVCLLVMELLKGGTVWEHYRNRSCSVATACAIGVSAAEGLHHAHERGALHRDVKPENLMLSEQRDLKVTDFGIAKIVGDAARLTGTGMLLGTPVYMAPEQVELGELSPATDVYALGTVVYELISDTLPFPEMSEPIAVVFARVRRDPIELIERSPGIDKDLSAVVMRAIARDPADRYGSARDFALALAEVAGRTVGPEWSSVSDVRMSGGFLNYQPVDAPTRRPAPETVKQPGTPEGWHPDPLTRHDDRYGNGESWTEHASDHGQTVVDPPGYRNPAAPAPAPSKPPPAPVVPRTSTGHRPWNWMAVTSVACAVVALVFLLSYHNENSSIQLRFNAVAQLVLLVAVVLGVLAWRSPTVPRRRGRALAILGVVLGMMPITLVGNGIAYAIARGVLALVVIALCLGAVALHRRRRSSRAPDRRSA